MNDVATEFIAALEGYASDGEALEVFEDRIFRESMDTWRPERNGFPILLVHVHPPTHLDVAVRSRFVVCEGVIDLSIVDRRNATKDDSWESVRERVETYVGALESVLCTLRTKVSDDHPGGVWSRMTWQASEGGIVERGGPEALNGHECWVGPVTCRFRFDRLRSEP